jgi:hypothetical protein
MSRFSSTQSKIIEHLATNIPWLGADLRKLERLELLIAEAYESAGVQGPELVSRLIHRFEYISNDRYDELIFSVASHITDHFDLTNTIICSATADRYKDSGQRILYDLVSGLAYLGHHRIRNLNRYDSIAKESEPFDSVLLVDEFIGTGQTMANRVKRIGELCRNKGRQVPSIHAIAIAGMSRGLRSIRHLFESLNVCVPLVMGIAQHARADERRGEYLTMLALEDALAPTWKSELLPRLGYGESEALYSRHRGSCPNNVLPIFWWPEQKRSGARQPLFPRAM